MASVLGSKLNPAVRVFFRRRQLVTRYTPKIEAQCRFVATRRNVDNEEVIPPIKYTTSKANKETAQAARAKATLSDTPISQPFSLMLSLGAFLIYFGCLREENDLDDIIYSDISNKVPALKEAHDRLQTRAGRDMGKSNVEQM